MMVSLLVVFACRRLMPHHSADEDKRYFAVGHTGALGQCWSGNSALKEIRSHINKRLLLLRSSVGRKVGCVMGQKRSMHKVDDCYFRGMCSRISLGVRQVFARI